MGNKNSNPAQGRPLPPPPKQPVDKLDIIMNNQRDQMYSNNNSMKRQTSLMEWENRTLLDGVNIMKSERSVNNKKNRCESEKCEKDMQNYQEKKREETKRNQQQGLSMLNENLTQITTLIDKTKSEVNELEAELAKAIKKKEDFEKKNKYYMDQK
jgi:hypothetical protein